MKTHTQRERERERERERTNMISGSIVRPHPLNKIQTLGVVHPVNVSPVDTLPE